VSRHTRLSIEGVTHRFGKVVALDSVHLAIEEGELVTLLGPSGCGKTTLLRIIAGFINPSEGRVAVEGRDVTGVPPHKRPVNMVFQRAALFPHLDVRANVAFGLQVAGIRGEEADSRVADALRLVRLEGYEQRRAHELSGGQMQRVALARALVNRPRVLLLDEPLSALDLKIRLEMEVELRRVHRETGATFVYVTHDQREALALSDRIVVFDNGHIEQVGTPDEIYHAPASPFAARFVGDANVIPVDVVSVHGDRADISVGGSQLHVPSRTEITAGSALLVIRPEVVRLSADQNGGLRGVVLDSAFRGTGFSYRVKIEGLDEPMKAEIAAEHAAPFSVGDDVSVMWERSSCRLMQHPSAGIDYHQTDNESAE
jgi:ABC-type Fe3+/spermidine/putrescine transport system ATPase subunit